MTDLLEIPHLTVFRELLQNADDAGAKTVKIRFYTEDGMSDNPTPDRPLPNLKNVPVRCEVSNKRSQAHPFVTLPDPQIRRD